MLPNFLRQTILLNTLLHSLTRKFVNFQSQKNILRKHAKSIDKTNMLSFFGIMYMCGLYRLTNHGISTLFSYIPGHAVFSATMSRVRFKVVLANLAFDDLSDRELHQKKDRFAEMRYVFKKCNRNFAKVMVPDFYLSLDKTLYPMHNQISFRQYNPDKPAKYGMLYKLINGAACRYTYQRHIYCRKREGTSFTCLLHRTSSSISLQSYQVITISEAEI